MSIELTEEEILWIKNKKQIEELEKLVTKKNVELESYISQIKEEEKIEIAKKQTEINVIIKQIDGLK
jgi:hypothetical protein